MILMYLNNEWCTKYLFQKICKGRITSRGLYKCNPPVVVTAQDNSNDVFTDVVDVTFHGRQYNRTLEYPTIKLTLFYFIYFVLFYIKVKLIVGEAWKGKLYRGNRGAEIFEALLMKRGKSFFCTIITKISLFKFEVLKMLFKNT